MPIFSTGGMRYQDGWKDKPLAEVSAASQQNLEATIRRSWELGLNHIETARGYGVSERQLGVILPTLPRDQLIAQTKASPKADSDAFLADVLDSLDRLQLDYVDLLGLHGINNREVLDQAIRPGGCLAAARELQRRGKVKHIGFSTHGSLDMILDAIRHDGDGGFDYVNLHWYFIMQHNWPAIVEARKRDMGVFIISPSDKGGKLYAPPPELSALCKPLHPMVFNDMFCLSHPEVHTLSLGAARPSDFDRHLEAIPLLAHPKNAINAISERLDQRMLAATGHRNPEALALQLAPWESNPEKLNFQVMLWLRNLARGWGMTEYGKMRFNLLGEGDHWFPGSHSRAFAEVSDEELLAAMPDIPEARSIPGWLREAVQLLGGETMQRLSQS